MGGFGVAVVATVGSVGEVDADLDGACELGNCDCLSSGGNEDCHGNVRKNGALKLRFLG